ncbi:MAG: T9SS type A sorting domain-containing protein [Bacteroidia bacterium]|nr:T9SS type A sorting domain-containing protein [Bacteroidia bacterium]
MKTLLKIMLSLLLLLGLGSNQSSASNVVCSEMSYTCTSTPGVYKIGIKLYRDCNGLEFCADCPSSLNSSCKVSVDIRGFDKDFLDIAYGNADLSIVKSASAFDVVQLCKTEKSICSNCGSRTPGTFSPGIEVYYFEGLVNLNTVPSACCKVRIGFSQCCRKSDLTTIVNPNATNYYTDIMINRCADNCNSSPLFTNHPVFVVCAGQDNTHTMGAIDPDGDSLSYEKGPMFLNRNTPVTYATPYSPTVPFPYLGAPIQSPPALPPAGIEINSFGEIRYRALGSFAGNMPLVVKQWQKINGKMELVGEVTRDIFIQSMTCPSNNPPVIRTYDFAGVLTTPQPAYFYNLDYGKQFCISIGAWDNTNSSDTTDFTWNKQNELFNAGATITHLYDPSSRGINGPKKDSIKFCWTPTFGDVRTEPYLLSLNASDRACPIKGSTTRYLSFKVNGVTALNEQSKNSNSFDVFPNPAKEQITIELGKPSSEKLFIELIAIDGKQVYTQYLSPNQTSLNIKLPGVLPGIYFVRINGSNFQVAKKVVVAE